MTINMITDKSIYLTCSVVLDDVTLTPIAEYQAFSFDFTQDYPEEMTGFGNPIPNSNYIGIRENSSADYYEPTNGE
jgi:hypothetical protein